MGHVLVTAGLAPLLLVQGLRARRSVLRLPEAAGDREGVYGSGTPLNLLVIGDSAAAGVGVEQQSQALTGLLVDRLGRRHSGRWRLIATTGHKIADVVQAAADAAPDHYDLVVVSAGVNDATGGTTLRGWQRSMERLVDVIGERFTPERIVVSAVPPMDRFPALPQPLRWYLGRCARRLNTATKLTLSTRPACTFLEFDVPLTPEHMAQDGFHPGPLAYEHWAANILESTDVTVDP